MLGGCRHAAICGADRLEDSNVVVCNRMPEGVKILPALPGRKRVITCLIWYSGRIWGRVRRGGARNGAHWLDLVGLANSCL